MVNGYKMPILLRWSVAQICFHSNFVLSLFLKAQKIPIIKMFLEQLSYSNNIHVIVNVTQIKTTL